MKYYAHRPVLVYLFLSVIGTLVVGGILLATYEATVGDAPDNVRLSIPILSFCSFILFFVLRAIYKRNYRDYVELLKCKIKWVSYSKRIESIDIVSTSDIQLIEIEYETGAKLPTYYNVFVNGKGRFKQLEIYTVSLDDIIRYCKENNIATRVTHLQFQDIENVKISAKRIKIKYCPKTIFRWGKTINIPFTEIAGITRVIMHPISPTQNHYVINTRSGAEYKLIHYEIDQILIETYAQANGMQVVEIRMEN